ncbi:MAG: AbrB family transcriptional regulator [Candidatus Hydrothermarchaeota archaeon]|nr:MAG: AbrB family transcriptional regulator [Candidatus Hydrothermarchaeota archaeon]
MSEILTKVGKKFVIVIPLKIRKEVKIREGDLLRVKLDDHRIILEKIPDPFKELGEIIGEPYSEERDEKKTEEWLKHASS